MHETNLLQMNIVLHFDVKRNPHETVLNHMQRICREYELESCFLSKHAPNSVSIPVHIWITYTSKGLFRQQYRHRGLVEVAVEVFFFLIY